MRSNSQSHGNGIFEIRTRPDSFLYNKTCRRNFYILSVKIIVNHARAGKSKRSDLSEAFTVTHCTFSDAAHSLVMYPAFILYKILFVCCSNSEREKYSSFAMYIEEDEGGGDLHVCHRLFESKWYSLGYLHR